MRIVCISYREWALEIYDKLSKEMDHTFLIIRNKKQYDETIIRDFKPDFILFYGWSWIIKSEIIEDFTCLMLHPSALPFFRGGSPIQNQIISGLVESKVSIFKMDQGIDSGPIYYQENYSLLGSLDEIFERITKIGFELTKKVFLEGATPKYQNHDLATYYKRRNPSESEITLNELQTKSSIYLYNKVRMLADPYPNAFIKTIDGKKLIIKLVEIANE
jgi:methionyl-tRNA formyltransferase